MEVREIMTSPAVMVGQDEPVLAAVRLLRRYNLGALPVCDGAGRLRGMVTDRDILLLRERPLLLSVSTSTSFLLGLHLLG